MQDPLHDSVLNMRCSQCETEIDKLQFYLHFCQAHLVCEEVWRFARCIIMKAIVVHGVWISCLTPTVIAEYLGGTDMCVDEREIPFAHSKTSGIQGWSWSADNSEWVWHKIIWGRAGHDVQYKSAGCYGPTFFLLGHLLKDWMWSGTFLWRLIKQAAYADLSQSGFYRNVFMCSTCIEVKPVWEITED